VIGFQLNPESASIIARRRQLVELSGQIAMLYKQCVKRMCESSVMDKK
jgi:hypothetical protein